MYVLHTLNIQEVYMIVMIGCVKGGTGKTMIATNLAAMRSAAGKKVLLVDGDEQKSTIKWANQRDFLEIETKLTTVSFAGKSLRAQVLRMKEDYDDVIIDVGGRETTSLRAALSIADVCLVPFRPRSADLWTLPDIQTVINEMKPANPNLQVFSIINQADSTGWDNEGSIDILQECEDIKCIDLTVGYRKAFPNAYSDGLSVLEMKIQDKKAVQEITNIYDFIYSKCISDVGRIYIGHTAAIQ